MILGVSVHVRDGDVVTMDHHGDDNVWMNVTGTGDEAVVYFESTNAARVFLATALSELRRIERGDLPYNTTDDKIEVKA